MSDPVTIELFWLPLGAGGSPLVRASGRLYERIAAHRGRRAPCDLYHSALKVHCGGTMSTVEMAPVWSLRARDRGVVAEGSVGSRLLGRSRWFRYEVRCWRGGVIPDEAWAVDGPVLVSTTRERATQLLALAASVPTLVWGRDELGTGEMWNCNSVISWLLTVSGHPLDAIVPPPGGRAPGWDAGVRLGRSVPHSEPYSSTTMPPSAGTSSARRS